MARQPRITSESGIYHVMLRGVNRMRIFHDKSDYRHFLEALELQTEKRVSALPSDRQAEELAHCEVYSFCLMTNHLHLLVRTMDEPIGKVMQRITSGYVYYFNHKYKRVGHLFQERFKSEPVEDEDYFITLLRYIHQNPVKAGMVEHVGEYTWSSWRELTSDGHPGFCNKQRVLELITLQELTDLVNNPMEHVEEEGIIDYDSDEEANGKSLLSPDDMLSLMIDYTGSHSAMEFRNLPKPVQRDCIGRIISEGGTIRELANLTGIPRSTVQRFASAWSDSKQPAGWDGGQTPVPFSLECAYWISIPVGLYSGSEERKESFLRREASPDSYPSPTTCPKRNSPYSPNSPHISATIVREQAYNHKICG